MCLLAKAPSSCQQLKEHELHLDGGRWACCYYDLSSLLLCTTLTIEAIPHLRNVDRNSLMLVRRRLTLTYTGLGKNIPNGIELTSVINGDGSFFASTHVPFVVRPSAALVPDWARSLSTSSTADTNECLDFSCRKCPKDENTSL